MPVRCSSGMTRSRATALMGLLALGGCVGTSSRVAEAGTAEQPAAELFTPRIVECPGYHDPPRPWLMPNRVRVFFLVLADGSVDPGSLRADMGWRYHAGEAPALERAREFALACTFSPARMGEDPVAMRVSRVFSFP